MKCYPSNVNKEHFSSFHISFSPKHRSFHSKFENDLKSKNAGLLSGWLQRNHNGLPQRAGLSPEQVTIKN